MYAHTVHILYVRANSLVHQGIKLQNKIFWLDTFGEAQEKRKTKKKNNDKLHTFGIFGSTLMQIFTHKTIIMQ